MTTGDPRDDPAVREAWEEWNRNTPEAFWDRWVWVKHSPISGSLDVADRFQIWAHGYAAALKAANDPSSESGAADDAVVR